MFIDSRRIGIFNQRVGPIAELFLRPDSANTLSISTDGQFVAAGPPGLAGETVLYRSDGTIVETSSDYVFASITYEDAWSVRRDEPGSALFEGIEQNRSLPGLDPLGGDLSAPASTIYDEHRAKGWLAYGAWPVETTIIDEESGAHIASIASPGAREGVSNTDLPPLTVTAFDPEGDRLLVGDINGATHVVDSSTWLVIDDHPATSYEIAAGAWSDDGSLVASSDASGVITIRDGTTFLPISVLNGSFGDFNSFAGGTFYFSSDNRYLLSNFDGPGRLWDLGTGEQIGDPLAGLQGTNAGANQGTNGFQLVTGTPGGMLVWNLDFDEWPAIACRVAGWTLTDDEWTQFGPRDTERYDLCESIGS